MTWAKNIWVKNSYSRCQSFTFTILRNLWLQKRFVTSFIFSPAFFVDVESGIPRSGTKDEKIPDPESGNNIPDSKHYKEK
jgi:hypothetical protein